MTTKERDAKLAKLRDLTAKKEAAVNACEFAQAASFREEERALERELGVGDSLTPTGQWHVRIERPDGGYCTATAPTLEEAMETHGLHMRADLSDQVDLVVHVAAMLHKAYNRKR